MTNNIDILIRAKDEASSIFKQIGEGGKLGFAAVAMAAGAAANFVMQATEETIKYIDSINDLNDISGLGTEEMSRLAQMTKETGIEQKELASILTTATKDGIDMTVEGLAKMSDEYLDLNPGTERANYLLDKFGKTGIKMAGLMAKGGDEIRKMSGEIAKSLVVTEQAAREVEAYAEEVAALKTEWLAFKFAIGREVIPILTQLTNARGDEILALKMERNELERIMNLANSYGYGIIANTEATKAQIFEIEKKIFKLMELGLSEEQAAKKVKEYTDAVLASKQAMEDLNTIVDGPVRKMIEDYNDGIADLNEKAQDHLDKITELEGKYWLTPAQKQQLEEEKQGLEEIRGKYAEITAESEEALNRWYYAEFEKRLSLDGIITEGEQAFLDQFAQNTGIYDEETAKRIDAVNEFIAKLEGASEEDARLVANIARPVTKVVNIVYNGAGYGWTDADERNDRYLGDFATGANFTVPSGFPNDTFAMRVSSGEHVVVTPQGKSMGGGIVVNLQYAPVVSVMDKYEAETKLIPYIEAALRKIR